MDSLQGIPVEYKLDTFYASHRHNFVTPKLAMSTRCFYSAIDTLAINSPLGHFSGDNAYSPPKKYQTHETHGDIQSSFTPTNTIPHTSNDMRCHLNLLNFSWLNFVSILTTFPRVLQHQKQTQYSMLQIKTIHKNLSTLAILLLHHPPFIFHNLARE